MAATAIVAAGMTAVSLSVVVVAIEMIDTGSSHKHSVDRISAQVGSIILLILSDRLEDLKSGWVKQFPYVQDRSC